MGLYLENITIMNDGKINGIRGSNLESLSHVDIVNRNLFGILQIILYRKRNGMTRTKKGDVEATFQKFLLFNSSYDFLTWHWSPNVID